MKKKISPKKLMAKIDEKFKDMSLADMYRGWLDEGFKEEINEYGEWLKVELTPDDERRFQQTIALHMLELNSPRITREEMIKKIDMDYQQILEKPSSVEALSWLQKLPEEALVISGGSGESGGLFQDEALALVQSLYKLGAVKVTALDIATDRSLPEHQNTDTLIIELPEDAKIRKQLFKKANQLAQKYHWDPQEDEGQKYLGIRWE